MKRSSTKGKRELVLCSRSGQSKEEMIGAYLGFVELLQLSATDWGGIKQQQFILSQF